MHHADRIIDQRRFSYLSPAVRKFFFFLLFFCAPSFLSAKDNGRFRHYTTEDGLSQNSVYCMVQDPQDFMWVGTSDGLCRYDGYHFTIFRPDPNDSATISNNIIRCLLVDREGKIWAGTRDGLNCYDPVSGKFTRFYAKTGDPSSLAENVVLALCEDASGDIWAATLGNGISIYQKKTKKFRQLHYSPADPNSICGEDVRGMCTDKNGHVWMATWRSGVCEFDPVKNKRLTYIAPEQLGYPNTRGAICCDANGKIWIGTWMRGLDCWDPAEKKIYHESDQSAMIPEMKCGMVWSITLDRQGRLLVGTAEQGLVIFDPVSRQYRKFSYDPDDPWALNDKSVWSVRQDRSGQIWAGTWRGGINVLDERIERFDLLRFDSKDSSSLPAATVWSLCGDGARGLWIGTAAGPVHYDPATKIYSHQVYCQQNWEMPPPNADIQALCHDKNGNTWMGSAGNGVYRYNEAEDKYHHYYPDKKDPHSVGDDIINTLCADEQGRVWVGAGHAPLQRYDPGTDGFISYPFVPADSNAFGIYCIVPGDKDEMLLGLLTGDVFSFNCKTEKFTRLWKNTTGIGITSIYRDQFGGTWVGTSGSGLVYLKNNSATFFTEKDGLPNNVINGILPGAKDELWLSSNRGLCRFDPISRDIRSYTPADGLQGNEFNQNCAMRSPDGKIWFGGVKGISAFYPREILPNLSETPVVITAFTVLNKPFSLPQDITCTNEISLSYLDYFFSFDFAGLEFTNPLRNHYQYMMEGFDADWVDAGTRRFATYTNLDPGDYVFRVKASNNDGRWGNTVREIHITITPPFWKTKWFYGLCALVLVLSAWGFIRRRERNLRREKQVLETKVAERTSELQLEKEKVTAAHKDIKDSINYAKRIQYALLAHEALLKEELPEHFVLFRPKDIVSGDFYWATRQGNRFYLAVCDSTGHGVPGAFMSLLNISFLNEAIIEKKMEKPGEIFNHVRARLIENISQDGGKDGMDAILLCIDPEARTITYAAAHNAPLIVRGNEVIQLPADKMPVGKGERTESFSTRMLQLLPGDWLYLYTDGLADQFGGPLGKKFKEASLRRLLAEIASGPAEMQQEQLTAHFDNWKGNLEQVDDVLILGMKII